MSAKDPVVSAARWAEDDRTPLAADDTNITNVSISSTNIIIAVQLDEQAGPWNNFDVKLRWRISGGSYADLGAATAIAYGTTTDLVNGTDLTTSGSAICTNNPGGSWTTGKEVEGTGTAGTISMADETYTEIHYAIDVSNAAYSSTYEFEVYDNTNGASIGDTGITLTTEAPPIEQTHYRLRDDAYGINVDNGWLAAQDNVPASQSIVTGQIIRARFKIERAGSGDAKTFKLQARHNAGTWADAHVADDTTSTPCVTCLPSTQFTDGDAISTERLSGTETFTNGEGIAAVLVSGNILTGSYDLDALSTEFEWCIRINSFFYEPGNSFDQIQAGDTIELRVVESDGTVLSSYVSPTITVGEDSYIGGTHLERGQRVLYCNSSGHIYYMCEDTIRANANPERMMLKSTDGGQSWRVQDDTNRPTTLDWESGDHVVNGSTLYIASQLNNDAYHDTFLDSTDGSNPDTWGTTDQAIRTGITRDDQIAAIARRADGDLIAFFQEQNTNFRIRYSIHAGVSWAAPVDLDSEAGDTFSDVRCVMDSSDLLHIFYQNLTDGTLWHNTLSTGDVLGTREEVGTSEMGTGSGEDGGICGVVYYDASGTERVVVGFRKDSDGYIYTAKVDNNGSPSSIVQASDHVVNNDKIGCASPAAELIVFGTTLYLIYADSTNGEIWLADSTDGGATWNAATKIVADVEAHQIKAHAYTRSNADYIGIVYEWAGAGNNGFDYYYEHPLDQTVTLDVLTLASAPIDLTVDVAAATIVPLDVLTLASSVIDLSVVPGSVSTTLDVLTLASTILDLNVAVDQTVVLDVLTLASSIIDLTVVPGEAITTLDVLTLASAVNDLTVVPGAISVVLDVLTLASSVQDLTVSNVVTVALDVLTLASTVNDLTVIPGAVSTILDVLTLASSTQDLTVNPGAVSVLLDVLTLVSSVQDLSVQSTVSVLLDVLTLASSVQDLTVLPGTVTVTLDTLSITSSVIDLTPEAVTRVLLDVLELASSVQDLSVSPGAVTVSLDVLTLASAIQDLSVTSGVRVTLDTLVLGSSIQDLSVVPGSVNVSLDVLSATLSPIDLSVDAGGVTIPLDPLTLASAIIDLNVVPGGVSVPLDVLTLTSSIQDLTVTVPSAQIIPLDVLILAAGVVDLTPSTPTIGVAGGQGGGHKRRRTWKPADRRVVQMIKRNLFEDVREEELEELIDVLEVLDIIDA